MRLLRAERTAAVLVILFAMPVRESLHLVPVAWLEQTMNPDPAVQWHLQGRFVSSIWPNSGAEFSSRLTRTPE